MDNERAGPRSRFAYYRKLLDERFLCRPLGLRGVPPLFTETVHYPLDDIRCVPELDPMFWRDAKDGSVQRRRRLPPLRTARPEGKRQLFVLAMSGR